MASTGLSALPTKILKDYGDGNNPDESLKFWLLYIIEALKLYGTQAQKINADTDQIITAGIAATDIVRIFEQANAPLPPEFVAAEAQKSEVQKALAEIPEKTTELKKAIEILLSTSRADVTEVIELAKAGSLGGIKFEQKSAVFSFEIDEENVSPDQEKKMQALISGNNVLQALTENLGSAAGGIIYTAEDGVHKKIHKNIDVFQSIQETAKTILNRITFGRAGGNVS